jgi:hypothetical protein
MLLLVSPTSGHRRTLAGLLAAMAIACWAPPPAVAGNLVITGHDSDYHAARGSAAGAAQVNAIVSFARAAAPDPHLPVLVFDHGDQLQGVLKKLGVEFRNVDPSAGCRPQSCSTSGSSARSAWRQT